MKPKKTIDLELNLNNNTRNNNNHNKLIIHTIIYQNPSNVTIKKSEVLHENFVDFGFENLRKKIYQLSWKLFKKFFPISRRARRSGASLRYNHTKRSRV